MKAKLLVVLLAGALAFALWWAVDPRADLPVAPGAPTPAEDRGAGTALNATADADADHASAAAQPDDSGKRVVRQAVDTTGRARATALDLAVRIVDPEGRPVPRLDVYVTADPSDGERRFTSTDARGEALLTGARAEIAADPDEEWWLVHDVAFEELPRTRLDAATLAQDVVVSVQPHWGTVHVVAVDANGRVDPSVDRAVLELVQPEEAGDPSLLWERRSWLAPPMRDGATTAEFVELGRTWAGLVYRPGAETGSRATAPGPVLPRQAITIEVRLDADHVVAVFRAVDASGTPLPAVALQVVLRDAFGGADELAVVTDASGHFPVDASGMDWFEEYVTVEREDETEPLTGAARLPEGMHNGRNDCGDVMLRPRSVLVAGQVTDAAGRPLTGVRVRATDLGVRYRGWSDPAALESNSTEGGAFAIQGDLPGDTFEVHVDSEHWRSDAVRATHGERGVQLLAYRIVQASVEVILAPGGSWDGFELALTLPGGHEPQASIESASQTDDVIHASMQAVRPGTYDLCWSFDGHPLGRRTGLRLEEEGTIAEIDLREKLFTHRVELSLSGVPDDEVSGVVLWRPAGSEDAWNSEDFYEPTVRLNALAPAVDVRVLGRGCREATREDVRGHAIVQLQAGYTVRLVLRTDGVIPPPPYVFDPAPMLHDQHVGYPVGSPYFTATKREAVFRVPAGRIDIHWHLEKQSHNAAIGSNVLPGHAVPIDVLPAEGEQVFVLELDGPALTELPKTVGW